MSIFAQHVTFCAGCVAKVCEVCGRSCLHRLEPPPPQGGVALPGKAPVHVPQTRTHTAAQHNPTPRIPPHMKPMKLKQLLSAHGDTLRVYCAPEDPRARKLRKRKGGNTGVCMHTHMTGRVILKSEVM